MKRMTQVNQQHVIILGASGAIGSALVEALLAAPHTQTIRSISRSACHALDPRVSWLSCDVTDEDSIAAAAAACQTSGPADLIINTIGVLHEEGSIRPEKGLRDLDGAMLTRLFQINAIGPALVLKHFSPLLARDRRAIFASLSARVGSISDNKAGGWYGYRASKAALNQFIKTAAVELAIKRPSAICVGLHPGTVRSQMSEPFLQRYTRNEIFEPATAAAHLLSVIGTLVPSDSGKVFGWDGQEILP
jgi:NAD(P)-dependent dehydrogenase (short-subunit alcohol dehydrogenase family)